MLRPSLHLGSMTFAWAQSSAVVDHNVASQMLATFAAAGGSSFDTARIYAGGDSEGMAGSVRPAGDLRRSFSVATKAHPSLPGGLSPSGLRAQLSASLEALQIDQVDVLYLHQPDTEHPLADTLACMNDVVSEGLVGAVGLSNYSAAETARCVELCAANNWHQPSVYQGLYSPLNRRVEGELLPLSLIHI
eukprot:TRINITY_DN23552_c0_g2_i2.p1 TRINITY_DN23552_c0_g2~~TRINITY_DN23552_c0_g2_i2.p1  ORF type:complete len:190 (+),score=35.02 TRINITY_DN23552_c0_g2_i2:159-728(+)